MLGYKAGALDALQDISEVWSTMQSTLEGEGISFFIYLTVNEARAQPHLLTNIADIYAGYPPPEDPFLSHCCHSYAITLTGVSYLPDYDYLPDPAKAFISRARETGFSSGLGIPMRLQGSSRYGGFNLGTGLKRADFEAQIIPRAEEFRVYCLLAHRRIEELLGAAAPATSEAFGHRLIAPVADDLAHLSPREREVAYLVAQGFSRKECARICAISPHTVSEYLKSVYSKLGINDRIKLSQMFAKSGLLDVKSAIQ